MLRGYVSVYRSILIHGTQPFVCSIGSNDFAVEEAGWNSLWYWIASIPGAMSMLYKEQAIQRQPMDVCYLNAWVSTYQFIFGILIAPVVLDVDTFHLNQKLGGLECLINGVSEAPTDQCQFGIVIVLGYVLAGFAMNTLMVVVIRSASLSLMYSTTAIAVPVGFGLLEVYQYSIATTMVHSNLTWDLVAIAVLVVGFVFYRSQLEPNAQALTMSAEEMEAASLLQDSAQDYNTS